jgi:ribosomal protein S18 acetylase RimI-like enzyme
VRDFEVINENLRCALAAFSGIRASGKVQCHDGIQLVYAGVPFGLFNTAHLTRTPDPGEFDSLLRMASDWYGEIGTAWSMWFCDEFMNSQQRRLSRVLLATAGLRPSNDAPGMIAQELLPVSRKLPPLDCRPVADEASRSDFAHIMSTAFHVPEDMARTVYCSPLLWSGAMQGWVGYAGKSAVSTAAVVMGGGAVGIYAVATHPKHQRKGYGEALVRHAVGYASRETGIRRTVLQSSLAGHSLYSRLGYRQAGRFLVYLHE